MSLRFRLEIFFKNIKYRCQRFVRGYADSDVWGFCDYFPVLFVKILTRLRDNRVGYPGQLTDDEWGNILNEMIECFTEYQEDKCSEKNQYEDDVYNAWYSRGELFRKVGDEWVINASLKDKDKELEDKYYARETEIYEYRQKKLQRGLELLTKYYNDLWD